MFSNEYWDQERCIKMRNYPLIIAVILKIEISEDAG